MYSKDGHATVVTKSFDKITTLFVPLYSMFRISLRETRLITYSIIHTQSGQPQPEPDIAVTVGQDTLSKVEGITYSAAVQVKYLKFLCLW